MLRTFIDLNGNIQYIPNTSDYTNSIYANSFYTNNLIQNNLLDPISYYAPRPIFYTNSSIVDVNDDPDLRKKICRNIYDKYVNVWLPFSFTKLQKYLINTDGDINFIKNMKEYEQEEKIDDLKIDFILNNVFGKHEVVKFLDKFVRNNNVNWYDLKSKHMDSIKEELYNKLKNHMKKIVIEKL